MRRSLVIGQAVAAFVAATTIGGVAIAASAATTPVVKTVTIAPTGCAGAKEFCFKPAPLTVNRSTKVVWKNMTVAPHTVTRCDVAHCKVKGGTGVDSTFHSPTINPGKTFAFTFRHPGTYVYYCRFHGYATMHGTITVR